MNKILKLKGVRSDNLLVVGRSAKRSTSGEYYWWCICDCGNLTVRPGSKIKSGTVIGCGCLDRGFKHGLSKDKEWKRLYDIEYRKKNRDKKRLNDKIYYQTHKKEAALYRKKISQTEKYKVRARAYNKKYREKHKEEIKKRNMLRKKELMKNPTYRLNGSMGASLSRCLKDGKGGQTWKKLVGYSLSDLKKHLEKQFKPGMTWDNYGKKGWEVDHIIPLSVFNFSDPSHVDFKRAWGLKNLQPMWSKENTGKKDRLDKHFQPCLRF